MAFHVPQVTLHGELFDFCKSAQHVAPAEVLNVARGAVRSHVITLIADTREVQLGENSAPSASPRQNDALIALEARSLRRRNEFLAACGAIFALSAAAAFLLAQQRRWVASAIVGAIACNTVKVYYIYL
jgi:hypothetical protein